MESKQSRSAKRKRPSNPFLGTFTRSKSQILAHVSRSGRRRSDSAKPPVRLDRPEPPSDDLGDVTRILIKDLRVRRVFSPSDGAQISEVKLQIGDGGSRKSMKVSGTNPNLSSIDVETEARIVLDCEKIGGEDMGFDSNGDGGFGKSMKVSGTNPNLSSIDVENDGGIVLDCEKIGGIRVSEKFDRGFDSNGDGDRKIQDVGYVTMNQSSGGVEKSGGLVVEGAGIGLGGEKASEKFDGVCDSNGDGDGKIQDGVGDRSGEVDCDFQVVGSVLENRSNGGVKKSEGLVVEGLRGQSDKGNGSVSKNKSVLKQRSRPKVFKPADSFSYRRLLPYLMDMDNDSSSSLPGDCSINQSSIQDKVHQSLATNQHEMLVDTCSRSNSGSNGLRDGSEENSTPMEIVTESLMPSGLSVCSLASADEDSCVKTPTIGGVKAFDRDPPSVTDSKNTNSFDTQQEGDDKSKQDSLVEELFQFTPPDATIGAKTIVDATESSIAECSLPSTERSLEKSSSGNIPRHNIPLHDKRNQSSFKSQPVLKQCSRMKLFRSPGSFSYRRLLPYLMDVAKEKSCASGNNQVPKINGCLEGNPLHQSTGLACKIIPTDDSGSDTVLRATTLTAASDSTNNSEPNVTSPEKVEVSPVSFNSDEALSTVADVKSNADTELETVTNTTLSICENRLSGPLSLLVSNGSSSGEGANSTTEHSSVITIGGFDSSPTAEAMSPLQSSSGLEVTVPLKNSPLASLKGILKRNPRGCRGLCTCLHCSSFRLNAEKAFEFSRNQMQDTEELTLDLINEIASLRNILEKCGGSADIWVNQVKEACRKASEAEEVAKQRLGQMNNDLDIHSRIRCSEPPRVRFTN